jgi:hypothetical protein
MLSTIEAQPSTFGLLNFQAVQPVQKTCIIAEARIQLQAALQRNLAPVKGFWNYDRVKGFQPHAAGTRKAAPRGRLAEIGSITSLLPPCGIRLGKTIDIQHRNSGVEG